MAYYPPPGYYPPPQQTTVSYGPGGVTQTTTTYGAPPPVMVAAPPMGFPPPPSVWTRQVAWADAYDRRMPFMVPYGLPPQVAMRMMRASEVFRIHDRDWSGNLDFHEFVKAMHSLGYYMPHHQLQGIFMMMDMDRSGRVNEREFTEYWGFYGYP